MLSKLLLTSYLLNESQYFCKYEVSGFVLKGLPSVRQSCFTMNFYACNISVLRTDANVWEHQDEEKYLGVEKSVRTLKAAVYGRGIVPGRLAPGGCAILKIVDSSVMSRAHIEQSFAPAIQSIYCTNTSFTIFPYGTYTFFRESHRILYIRFLPLSLGLSCVFFT